MRCNRLVNKSKFFVIAAILLASFLMPAKANAGICFNDKECFDASGPEKCLADQGYTDKENCSGLAKTLKADELKKQSENQKKGLSALKSSVETLTKGTKTLEKVIGGYIKTALTLVGTLFMALTFYGGYIWFIARDDEEEAKRAKSIISMALIGLIIVLAAYFVTYFIIYRLTAASGVGL